MNQRRIVIFGWASSVHIRRWAYGLTDRGWQVKVISLGGEKIENIDTTIFPRQSKLSYLKYSRHAATEAINFEPDIVHVHYAGGFCWWGRKSNFKPTVISVWGSDILKFPSNRYAGYIIKKSLIQSDGVTATSQYLAQATEKIIPALSDKINIVPFGVKPADEITDLPSAEPIKICYIKAHRSIYGPDILLNAIAHAKKSIRNIQVSMAGEGEMTDQLKSMISKLGLDDNVILVGKIDYNRIPDFISEHHFMVMPSRSESFGVAALDAAAVGRPTIATRVGGIPEAIIDNQTGILVPQEDEMDLANAIINLSRDMDKIKSMGIAGYKFVKENFDWQKSLDMMIEFYERLLNEKK